MGASELFFRIEQLFRICTFWFRLETQQVACGISGAYVRWLWEFGVDYSLSWIVSNVLRAHTVKVHAHIWNSTTCLQNEYGSLPSCLLSFSSGGSCSTTGAQLQHVSACLSFRTKSANLAAKLADFAYSVLPAGQQGRNLQSWKAVYCWSDNLPAPEQPQRGFLASA